MEKFKSYFNWSGGKDSALSLYHVLRDNNFNIQLLLTSVNSTYQRISMHGVRTALLHQQAESLGLPLQKIELSESPSMEEYNQTLRHTMGILRAQDYTHSIFGDIFLEDLRAYREEQLKKEGIQAHFPLWKKDTKALLHEFIDLGFKTIIVCIKSDLLDQSFAGRIIDKDFLNDLPSNVDPCGENGEFHTFVFDGPIFKSPINFDIGEKVFREYKNPNNSTNVCSTKELKKNIGFWFCDLLPKQ